MPINHAATAASHVTTRPGCCPSTRAPHLSSLWAGDSDMHPPGACTSVEMAGTAVYAARASLSALEETWAHPQSLAIFDCGCALSGNVLIDHFGPAFALARNKRPNHQEIAQRETGSNITVKTRHQLPNRSPHVAINAGDSPNHAKFCL